MLRRLPLSLRTWSGAALVCALFVCLTGLARPAMAMPGPMDMAPHAAAPAAVVESPGHGPGCPLVEEQCAAPKGVLAQDGPSVPVLSATPRVMACSPVILAAQPNAPPPPVAPPDLHRLCVSRT